MNPWKMFVSIVTVCVVFAVSCPAQSAQENQSVEKNAATAQELLRNSDGTLKGGIVPEVLVAIDKDHYGSKDIIEVIVKNNSSGDIWIDVCNSPFYLWKLEKEWTRYLPSPRLCVLGGPLKIVSQQERKYTLDLTHEFLNYDWIEQPQASMTTRAKLEFVYGLSAAEHLSGSQQSFSNEFKIVQEVNSSEPKVEQESHPPTLPSLKTLGRQIEILVRQYYPQAEISISDDKIIFSNAITNFMIHPSGATSPRKANGEWQEAVSVKGPQRTNGIQGSIEIASGLWPGQAVVPQSFDKYYFTSLLMAPHSSRYDCHVIVRLDYPDSVQEFFLKSFQDLVNAFERYLSSPENVNVTIENKSNQDISIQSESEEGICRQDQDCRIVTSYQPPLSQNAPGKTLIHCAHKERPLKEGEWIEEYNEYTQAKCVCETSSRQCRMKK